MRPTFRRPPSRSERPSRSRRVKPYYDEVSGTGDDRTLHVATIVPAVTVKCAKCHGVKEGDLLGFIRYEIPVK